MADFIRVYLGLMGSGKTTQAFADVQDRARLIIYSPGTSNEKLKTVPHIYDTPEYLAALQKYLDAHPRLRIEKRASPSTLFEQMALMRGYTFLLDDFAALVGSPEEKAGFQGFIRTVRYNGNQVVITTHRANSDLPPLVRVVATSIFYVGPSHRGTRELQTLYELVNYPISEKDFYAGLMENKAFQSYPIRMPN